MAQIWNLESGIWNLELKIYIPQTILLYTLPSKKVTDCFLSPRLLFSVTKNCYLKGISFSWT